MARAREWLGLRGGRAPKKEDYLYNFANSGAACRNLMGGRFRQAPRLVALMDEEPERWMHGVVVIRIGLNNWGGLLDLQARDPSAPELRAATAYCAGEIGAAVALIHASHPSTRILLVGIGNEADDPANFDRWQSAAETANIGTALDGFNAAIRRLADGDPRLAYFDDLAWFQARWGSRERRWQAGLQDGGDRLDAARDEHDRRRSPQRRAGRPSSRAGVECPVGAGARRAPAETPSGCR